jgi:hypothetical protein
VIIKVADFHREFRCSFVFNEHNQEVRTKRGKEVMARKFLPYSHHLAEGLTGDVECGAVFSCQAKLTQHYWSHIGHKPYACKFCPMTFTSAGNRRDHMNRHVNNKQFECRKCGLNFYRRYMLVNHMQSRHQITIDPLLCSADNNSAWFGTIACKDDAEDLFEGDNNVSPGGLECQGVFADQKDIKEKGKSFAVLKCVDFAHVFRSLLRAKSLFSFLTVKSMNQSDFSAVKLPAYMKLGPMLENAKVEKRREQTSLNYKTN